MSPNTISGSKVKVSPPLLPPDTAALAGRSKDLTPPEPLMATLRPITRRKTTDAFTPDPDTLKDTVAGCWRVGHDNQDKRFDW